MLTHNQTLVLRTLNEHKQAGGEAIGNTEIDHELNRRHNRTMGYDSLHGVLSRLRKRGLVRRTGSRPARYEITPEGVAALG